MSILDGDDIAAPHIPQRETNVPDSGTPDDDDLVITAGLILVCWLLTAFIRDFTWSLGVGDHRG